MDNEALSLSEDPPVLSGNHSLEGVVKKVVSFSRFLSKTEEDVDDKFKIQKKVCTIVNNEYFAFH